MARVASENEAAASLLKLCSLFAPDDIWLSDIASGAEDLPEPLRSCVADELELNDALALLRSFSLIGVDEEKLSCHRLVQWVTRDRLSEPERAAWRSAALQIVLRAFPDKPADPRTWDTCARLLPHARSVTSWGGQAEPGMEARLLNDAAVYLLHRAQYAEAEPFMRRALSIDEASYGPEHPEVATDLNDLATLLKATNRLGEAEPLMRRALSILERSLGPDHPRTQTVRRNLGGSEARTRDPQRS
jgi:tetratricopeptide (TPR) repeat protein